MATSYSRATQVVRIPKDSENAIVTVRFLKDDGDVRDISGATGALLFHASTESGTAVTTNGAASFTTDGTDGKLSFPLTATEVGTVRNLRCEFEAQGVDGENVISEMFMVMITERAKVV